MSNDNLSQPTGPAFQEGPPRNSVVPDPVLGVKLREFVRRGEDGNWYYVSADPFVDGQPIGEIRPKWVQEAIAEAEARDVKRT